MAKVIEIKPNHTPGMYDSSTGESLIFERLVDITEDMGHRRNYDSVILGYVRASNGLIVQCILGGTAEKLEGTKIHWYVDNLSSEMLLPKQDNTFDMVAHRLGLTPLVFLNRIVSNAPSLTITK